MPTLNRDKYSDTKIGTEKAAEKKLATVAVPQKAGFVVLQNISLVYIEG